MMGCVMGCSVETAHIKRITITISLLVNMQPAEQDWSVERPDYQANSQLAARVTHGSFNCHKIHGFEAYVLMSYAVPRKCELSGDLTVCKQNDVAYVLCRNL